VMIYKDDAPTVDATTFEFEVPKMDDGLPATIDLPAGDPAAPGAESTESGDPLEDMLKDQEKAEGDANKSIEDALKAK